MIEQEFLSDALPVSLIGMNVVRLSFSFPSTSTAQLTPNRDHLVRP